MYAPTLTLTLTLTLTSVDNVWWGPVTNPNPNPNPNQRGKRVVGSGQCEWLAATREEVHDTWLGLGLGGG